MEEILNAIKVLKKEMSQRFDKIEDKLDSLALTSNDDVIALLKRIEKNTRDLSSDIEYLTGKVGNHERILNRAEQ